MESLHTSFSHVSFVDSVQEPQGIPSALLVSRAESLMDILDWLRDLLPGMWTW